MKVFGTVIMAQKHEHELLEMESHHRQIRVFVAAKSMAEALRKLGLSSSERAYTSETGNRKEIEIAMSKPGQIFALKLDDYDFKNVIEIERDPYVSIPRRPRIPLSQILTKTRVAFTREELEYLRDIMQGANNPIAAKIGEKAAQMLEAK